MKKIIMVMAVMLLCGVQMNAEKLRFLIHYEEVKNLRGELYQYSERYLGESDVVKEDETYYKLLSITLLNNEEDKKSASKITNYTRTTSERQYKPLVGLNEESLMATNTAKKAESVAKQIYRIREARINILSGESAEHAPSDGAAMKTVMKELNKMEQDLAALFIGKTYISKHTDVVIIEVDENQMENTESILFRFSKFAGPVDKDDLSGEPIYLTREVTIGTRAGSKKNTTENYVEDSNLKVTYNGKVMFDLSKSVF